jgi:hypothetical protein
LEDLTENLAKINQTKNVVLLCDRGLMDGSAYLSKKLWDQMLFDFNVNEVHIREMRYHGVLHLVTAADGAEEYFTLANNSARSESIPDAINLDKRLQ